MQAAMSQYGSKGGKGQQYRTGGKGQQHRAHDGPTKYELEADVQRLRAELAMAKRDAYEAPTSAEQAPSKAFTVSYGGSEVTLS